MTDLLDRTEKAKEKFDVVAILGGTNDIGTRPTTRMVEWVQKVLGDMHARAKKHGARTVGITVPQYRNEGNKMYKAFSEKKRELNKWICEDLKCDAVADIYNAIDSSTSPGLWDDDL